MSLHGNPAAADRLTPHEIAVLRRTFAQVQSQGTIAALLFYQILFDRDPSLRGMFHTSIELQGRKLMDALNFIISSLDSPARLSLMMEGLGRRHVAYGTTKEHYNTVRLALLQMLAQTLGTGYTPEASAAWQKALEHVSAMMLRGAERSAPAERPR